MPEQTACDLERILSLSTGAAKGSGPAGPAASLTHEAVAHGELDDSLFFEVLDEEVHQTSEHPRTHFDGAMGWASEYGDQELQNSQAPAANAHEDAAPWNAHGPGNYGSPHKDPDGPADLGPSRSGNWDVDWRRVGSNEGPGSVPSRSKSEAASEAGASEAGASEAGATGPTDPSPPEIRAQLPKWAYKTLPRDCLMMLLQSALMRMPQEAEVVARCTQALSPLSPEEYERCFGSIPDTSCSSQQQSGAAAAMSRPAIEADAEVDKTSQSVGALLKTAQSLRGSEQKTQERQEKSRKIEPRPSQAEAPKLERKNSHGAVGAATLAAGEERSEATKGGARANIRLTESRAGTRTSVLTELEAIEVFKQRPAKRSERASLCTELAQQYLVTTTAIRHIWDRRTWVWTNIPYWTEAEMAASLAEGTCNSCKAAKVGSIEDTCPHCPINRKRGRPRGARDTYRRQRKNP